MAYITPNTEIYFYKAMPLDKDYNHTLYFSTNAEQQNFFINEENEWLSMKYTNRSYQRVGTNKIRVGKENNSTYYRYTPAGYQGTTADFFYGVNYMAFRNTAYGNKWFYAFVDSIEYINDNVAELTYTVDVMQTWYFDYALGECFVEREHTLTDNLFENIVVEDVENTGDVVNNTMSIWEDSDFDIIVYYVPTNKQTIRRGMIVDNAYTFNIQEDDDTRVSILNGMISGYKHVEMPYSQASTLDYEKSLNNLFNALTKINANIINVAQVPASVSGLGVTPDRIDEYGHAVSAKYEQEFREWDAFVSASGDESYRYEPINKKLLSYPYKKLIVSNNLGQSIELKWELFRKTNNRRGVARFNIYATLLPNAECYLIPTNYRGITGDDTSNALIINEFVPVSWNIDSFSQWWSQNKTAYIGSLITTVIKAGANNLINKADAVSRVMSTGDVGNAGSMLTSQARTALDAGASITSSLLDLSTKYKAQDNAYGQINGSSFTKKTKRIGYTFYDVGIPAEVAKIIDDYFSMFGYAIKEVKVPNIRKMQKEYLRPEWNYIKTNGCIIHGVEEALTPETKYKYAIPADDESLIASIYDRGITFWNNPTHIGNYGFDNFPQPQPPINEQTT